MGMGKPLKRVAPNAARGVPVAEAAKYLGVSEPTVRLWVRRGALARRRLPAVAAAPQNRRLRPICES